MESITFDTVSAALDVLMKNQQVLSRNLAAIDAQNFQQLVMDKQSALQSVSKNEAVNLNHYITSSDQSVTEDQLIARIAQNGLEYGAVIEAYRQYGSLMKTAIRGGRG